MASLWGSLRNRQQPLILPFIEVLEVRVTPAVFIVVADTSDGAAGSFRDAINMSAARRRDCRTPLAG
jgi:hypothetical protein